MCCQPSVVRARGYLLVGSNIGALVCQVVPGESVHRRDMVYAPVRCQGLAHLQVSGSKLAPRGPRYLVSLQQDPLQVMQAVTLKS